MKRVKEYNYQCPFLLTHILAKLMLRITRKSCHFLPKVLPHRLIHANWLVWRNEAKRAKKATLCLCSGSKCGQPACSERSSLLYPCGKPFGRKRQTFPVIGRTHSYPRSLLSEYSPNLPSLSEVAVADG